MMLPGAVVHYVTDCLHSYRPSRPTLVWFTRAISRPNSGPDCPTFTVVWPISACTKPKSVDKAGFGRCKPGRLCLSRFHETFSSCIQVGNPAAAGSHASSTAVQRVGLEHFGEFLCSLPCAEDAQQMSTRYFFWFLLCERSRAVKLTNPECEIV